MSFCFRVARRLNTVIGTNLFNRAGAFWYALQYINRYYNDYIKIKGKIGANVAYILICLLNLVIGQGASACVRRKKAKEKDFKR